MLSLTARCQMTSRNLLASSARFMILIQRVKIIGRRTTNMNLWHLTKASAQLISVTHVLDTLLLLPFSDWKRSYRTSETFSLTPGCACFFCGCPWLYCSPSKRRGLCKARDSVFEYEPVAPDFGECTTHLRRQRSRHLTFTAFRDWKGSYRTSETFSLMPGCACFF